MIAYKGAVSAFISAAAMLALVGSASAASLQMCKEDAARLCPGVEMGKGRILKCMKAHENEVSIGCAKELKKMKG